MQVHSTRVRIVCRAKSGATNSEGSLGMTEFLLTARVVRTLTDQIGYGWRRESLCARGRDFGALL